jgi:hypothetical protein
MRSAGLCRDWRLNLRLRRWAANWDIRVDPADWSAGRSPGLGRLCGVRHAATKLIPSMEETRSLHGATRGHGSRGCRNLAFAVEQNYGKNAPLVADMFRIQIAAAMCFWPRRDHAGDSSDRRLSLSDSQKPVEILRNRPDRNPRGRIRHAIRSSETTLGYNPPARSSRQRNLESDPRPRRRS